MSPRKPREATLHSVTQSSPTSASRSPRSSPPKTDGEKRTWVNIRLAGKDDYRPSQSSKRFCSREEAPSAIGESSCHSQNVLNNFYDTVITSKNTNTRDAEVKEHGNTHQPLQTSVPSNMEEYPLLPFVKEAPTFYPSLQEFSDPIAYITSIKSVAAPYGICKVVPPPQWKLPWLISDRWFSFRSRLQRIHLLSKRPALKRKNKAEYTQTGFESDYSRYRVTRQLYIPADLSITFGSKSRSQSSLKIPLWNLYFQVSSRGGYNMVTLQDKWDVVGVSFTLLAASISADNRQSGSVSEKIQDSLSLAKFIQREYCRLLYSYEMFDRPDLSASFYNHVDNDNDTDGDDDYLDSEDVQSFQFPPFPYSSISKVSNRHVNGHTSSTNTVPCLKSEHGNNGLLDKAKLPCHSTIEEDFFLPDSIFLSKFNYEKDDSNLGLGADAKCQVCLLKTDESLLLLCDGCDRGYHSFCLSPEVAEVPEGEWFCQHCICIASDFGFDEGKDFDLDSFQLQNERFSHKFMSQRGYEKKTMKTCQGDKTNLNIDYNEADVEYEFWKAVEVGQVPVSVDYGSELHSSMVGSGFPISAPSMSGDGSIKNVSGEIDYVKSGWNLNNIAAGYRGSILSFIDHDISGVTVPWVYVGMMFSSFCWHNEDHYLYSINYNHRGSGKQWYGVPATAADNFETVMKQHLSSLFEHHPDLLYHIVTMISPRVLVSNKVPLYKVTQYPGEFIITFPQAYHAGFSYGFNVGEAVNFALLDWIGSGIDCIERYRSYNRMPVFSMTKLFMNIIQSEANVAYGILSDVASRRMIRENILAIFDEERQQRFSSLQEGVRWKGDFDTLKAAMAHLKEKSKEAKPKMKKYASVDSVIGRYVEKYHNESSLNGDDDKEDSSYHCSKCNHILLLSAWSCDCCPASLLCSRCRNLMCACDQVPVRVDSLSADMVTFRPSARHCYINVPLDELKRVLQSVSDEQSLEKTLWGHSKFQFDDVIIKTERTACRSHDEKESMTIGAWFGIVSQLFASTSSTMPASIPLFQWQRLIAVKNSIQTTYMDVACDRFEAYWRLCSLLNHNDYQYRVIKFKFLNNINNEEDNATLTASTPGKKKRLLTFTVCISLFHALQLLPIKDDELETSIRTKLDEVSAWLQEFERLGRKIECNRVSDMNDVEIKRKAAMEEFAALYQRGQGIGMSFAELKELKQRLRQSKQWLEKAALIWRQQNLPRQRLSMLDDRIFMTDFDTFMQFAEDCMWWMGTMEDNMRKLWDAARGWDRRAEMILRNGDASLSKADISEFSVLLKDYDVLPIVSHYFNRIEKNVEDLSHCRKKVITLLSHVEPSLHTLPVSLLQVAEEALAQSQPLPGTFSEHPRLLQIVQLSKYILTVTEKLNAKKLTKKELENYLNAADQLNVCSSHPIIYQYLQNMLMQHCEFQTSAIAILTSSAGQVSLDAAAQVLEAVDRSKVVVDECLELKNRWQQANDWKKLAVSCLSTDLNLTDANSVSAAFSKAWKHRKSKSEDRLQLMIASSQHRPSIHDIHHLIQQGQLLPFDVDDMVCQLQGMISAAERWMVMVDEIFVLWNESTHCDVNENEGVDAGCDVGGNDGQLYEWIRRLDSLLSAGLVFSKVNIHSRLSKAFQLFCLNKWLVKSRKMLLLSKQELSWVETGTEEIAPRTTSKHHSLRDFEHQLSLVDMLHPFAPPSSMLALLQQQVKRSNDWVESFETINNSGGGLEALQKCLDDGRNLVASPRLTLTILTDMVHKLSGMQAQIESWAAVGESHLDDCAAVNSHHNINNNMNNRADKATVSCSMPRESDLQVILQSPLICHLSSLSIRKVKSMLNEGRRWVRDVASIFIGTFGDVALVSAEEVVSVVEAKVKVYLRDMDDHNNGFHKLDNIDADESDGAREGCYCYCRNGTTDCMVQCNSCDEWYHLDCVGLVLTDVLGLSPDADYHCPTCCDDLQIHYFRSPAMNVTLKSQRRRPALSQVRELMINSKDLKIKLLLVEWLNKIINQAQEWESRAAIMCGAMTDSTLGHSGDMFQSKQAECARMLWLNAAMYVDSPDCTHKLRLLWWEARVSRAILTAPVVFVSDSAAVAPREKKGTLLYYRQLQEELDIIGRRAMPLSALNVLTRLSEIVSRGDALVQQMQLLVDNSQDEEFVTERSIQLCISNYHQLPCFLVDSTTDAATFRELEDLTKLYCICRRRYSNKMFMVLCDVCEEWYHGVCVGLDEDRAAIVEKYECEACRGKAQ